MTTGRTILKPGNLKKAMSRSVQLISGIKRHMLRVGLTRVNIGISCWDFKFLTKRLSFRFLGTVIFRWISAPKMSQQLTKKAWRGGHQLPVAEDIAIE